MIHHAVETPVPGQVHTPRKRDSQPPSSQGLARQKARSRVVIADDDRDNRDLLAANLTDRGFAVVVAEDGRGAMAHVEGTAPDILLTDLRMPGMDGIALMRKAREVDPELIVLLMTGYADVDTALQAMREGADDYLSRPLKMEELAIVIERALSRRALQRETTELRARLKGHLSLDRIIGTSLAMQDVLRVIEQVAPSRASVLITGESGTGKELVAQALHEQSPRAPRPFVKLHCAALAENLLESELFGHEKGAFTGSAARREGRFKQADGGTLFLDEIGDISPSIQVKLLRFLQERTFERVGCNETLKVDVRIIAATNRDLSFEVSAGRFREDLFYRLNVVNLEVPPLRARPNDVLPLAMHFLARFAKENGKSTSGFDDEAMAHILAYRWPGNVRELENAIERAVVLADRPLIGVSCLPVGIGPATKGTVRIPGSTLEEIERHAILATLEACNGRTAQAAQMLDVSVRKIQYRLNEYGIQTPRMSSRPPPIT